jgi:BolA protein
MPEPSAADTTKARIEAILDSSFQPAHLEVIDHSHHHIGHPGASEGGHFEVVIVSDAFDGLSRIQAQRLVHTALADLLQSSIHALAVRTLSPARWAATRSPTSQ